MQDTLPFLDRLALGADADARAIRRAYARELKLIDQASEAAQFQDLRDAYETALRWAAYQARLAARPDGAVAATAVEAVEADLPPSARCDPRALASIAFDQFVAARMALTAATLIDEMAVWEDALRHRLDSDELINIEARAHFEGMIALLLAQGWQAGHQALLPAASSVFNWVDDPRRLRQFDQFGMHVNQAIEEWRQFMTQPLKQFTIERDILDRLRLLQVPDNNHVRRYIPVVERMLARYPAFMAITVSPEPIAQWQMRHRALPPRPAAEASFVPTLPIEEIGNAVFTFGRVAITVIIVINLLRLLLNAWN